MGERAAGNQMADDDASTMSRPTGLAWDAKTAGCEMCGRTCCSESGGRLGYMAPSANGVPAKHTQSAAGLRSP